MQEKSTTFSIPQAFPEQASRTGSSPGEFMAAATTSSFLPERTTNSAAAVVAADPYEKAAFNYKVGRGRVFLKDSTVSAQTLPQLLPKGLPYATNFISLDELKARGALNTSRRDEVSVTSDQLRLLYQAKCIDQCLAPSWEREMRFMELVSANCRSSFFVLPENGFGKASAEAIKCVLSANQRYSVLNLSGNQLRDEGAAHIADLLRMNHTLVHVDLSSNDIGHAGGTALAEALRTNNTVISLDLGAKLGANGNHIGSIGAQAVGELLKTTQVLWRLSLGSNGLGPSGLSHLIGGLMTNQTLVRLDLSGNSLGVEGATVLAQVLQRGTLSWLSLERNSLGDKGGKIVFEAISGAIESGSSDTLEYLDVESNELGPLAAKAASRALVLSTALRTLRFSANLFSSADSPSKMIMDGLAENKGLISLSLSGCGLREGDGAAIGRCLAQNAVLQVLDLSKNNLKDAGAKEVARGLASNRSLLRLDLSSNKIGDAGGREIAASVTHNCALRNLSLRRNAMPTSTGEFLSEALRSNATIEKMDTSYNDFSYKSTVAIKAILQRNAEANKKLVIPQLNSDIEVLAPKERELEQVVEEIDMEKRVIKDRSEQILRRNEESRVVLEKARRDVIELEKSVEHARTTCESAEEVFRHVEDRVSNEAAAFKSKKSNMEARIQQEKDRVDRMQRDMEKMRRQIKQMEDAENVRLAPLLADLQQSEVDCAREQEDAKFEAEKLATFSLRKKELEIALNNGQKGKKTAAAV